MRFQLLKDVGQLVKESENPKNLFVNWTPLLGFEIGWLDPKLAAVICRRYGLNPQGCEIIMMEANDLTDCHLHETGATLFLPLGKEHGFEDPDGGTLFGDFVPGQQVYNLTPTPAVAGETFEVPAGKIHAFYAKSGKKFRALGFVKPLIKDGDEFDIVPLEFVSTDLDNCVVRLSSQEAVVVA